MMMMLLLMMMMMMMTLMMSPGVEKKIIDRSSLRELEHEGTDTLGHAMLNPVYVVAVQVTTPSTVTKKRRRWWFESPRPA